MRYFLFNNASPAAIYGIGTYLRHLVCMLECIGNVEIVFVDLNCAEKIVCESVQDNKGYWHLQIPIVGAGVEDAVYNRNVYNYIVRWNENKGNDTLIFHFHYTQHSHVAALLKARYVESKILYTVHYQAWSFELKGDIRRLSAILEAESPEDLPELQEQAIQTVYQTVAREKEMLSIADEIIVLSKFTCDVLTRLYKIDVMRIHLIYNTIVENVERQKEICPRKSYGLDILYVGRLDLNKGLGYLISAFKKVYEKIPDSRLIIAGNGNYDDFLPLVGDAWPRIYWLGRVNEERLLQLYKMSAIGILPSLNEQCSYTIIEMLMNGLPVIGTDCSSVKEMLEHAPHLRIPVDGCRDDHDKIIGHLGEKIVTLLSNPEDLEKECRRANKAYQERYSLSVVLSKWKELLKQPLRKISENNDLLKMIDAKMFTIIDSRADYMDLSFFGLSGLGLYLWWRITTVDNDKLRVQIGENLIYGIDWIYEEVMQDSVSFEPALIELVLYLEKAKFYPTKTEKLLPFCRQRSTSHITAEELVVNALKIYNYR